MHDVYLVTEDSAAFHQLVGWAMVGLTAVFAAVMILMFRWRGLIGAILVGIVLPTAVATIGTSIQTRGAIALDVRDAMIALATYVGLPAAAVGCLIGGAARWVLNRRSALPRNP